ncbi:dirigent protein 22-like [Euphorbia lathyris]|uniref:dirigent protein 22-like n=1 Tax=Euphorbia lathyris TaxID=212925 RepID=UPI0033141065
MYGSEWREVTKSNLFSITSPRTKAMTKTISIQKFLCLIMLLVLNFGSGKSKSFSTTLSPATLGLKKEKLSHLHFYFHDILSGRNPSAVPVANGASTNKSLSGFGLMMMMDDPLTAEPDRRSELVGKAQGIYASASQSEVSFLMVLNFAFSHGKYNGSNLSVLGRNSIFSGVREMPIVGGSGLFRFARGYAQAKTHFIDFKTGDAIVEYNVFVFHY